MVDPVPTPKPARQQQQQQQPPKPSRPLTPPPPQDDDGGDDDACDGPEGEKKMRFVWTPELHRRFEDAVLRLGVAQAKPQAIRQLMGCETEDEPPTRQNIKSHLQKYRLLVQKQSQRQQPSSASKPLPDESEPAPSPALASTPAGPNAPPVIQPLMQQQQVGLLAQLELQAKLHQQMMLQRRTQAELGFRMSASGQQPALDRGQLHRLAQHVLLQRLMLQHLCSLLHATSTDDPGDMPHLLSITDTVADGFDVGGVDEAAVAAWDQIAGGSIDSMDSVTSVGAEGSAEGSLAEMSEGSAEGSTVGDDYECASVDGAPSQHLPAPADGYLNETAIDAIV